MVVIKNWISQGLTADKAVVIADLIIDGKSYGPHGFVMDFRRNGQLVDGIDLADMGTKTTGNDLDNAWISFKNVWLDKSALLNRYGKIKNGRYVPTIKGIHTMDMIGQRLYTGRVAVAWGALSFARTIIEQTKGYSDNKLTWSKRVKYR
eukprot:UN34577